MSYSYIKVILCFLGVIFLCVSCNFPYNSEKEKDEWMKEEIRKANKSMMDGDNVTALEIQKRITRENPDQLSLKSRNELVRCYSNIGYIQFFCNQDYMSSYEALITGKDIGETLPNCQYLPEIYLNLANVYGVYRDNQNTQKLFTMAFDEALYRQNYNVLLTAVYNMLSLEMSGMLEKEGQMRLEKFKKLQIPDHPMLPIVSNLYEVYDLHHSGHSQDAINTLQQIKSQPNNLLTPKRLMTLCDLYSLRVAKESGLPEEYNKYAHRLEEQVESADIDMQVTIYNLLASFYASRGDLSKALYNNDLERHINDSIFAVSKYSLLNDMLLQVKEKRHGEELAVEKEKEQRLRTWLLAVLIYVVIMAVGIAIIVFQNRKLRARNKELYLRFIETQKMEEELFDLRKSAEMPALIENESKEAENKDEEAKQEGEITGHIAMLAEKIVNILNDENEVTQLDFSLEKLTKLAKSNRNYVSQVINTLYKKNFNSVLGELRVKIACRHLSESGAFRNMTVEALAEAVGFKSRSNFVVVFKKITGLSPSDYRRSVEK